MRVKNKAFGPVLLRDYPIGTLGLMDDGRGLSRVFLWREDALPCGWPEGETPLTAQGAAELDEYFSGKRKAFTVVLSPHGTAFQLSVWEALRAVPYGQTKSYGQVAAAVGRPQAARAVGMANHDNPLLIFTRCHRIVGSGGALTGFACGLEVKRRLLELEGALPANKK